MQIYSFLSIEDKIGIRNVILDYFLITVLKYGFSSILDSDWMLGGELK